MTVDKFLTGALDEAPFIIATTIILWLSLPQLAERFEIINKILRPLSRRWREKADQLDAQRRSANIKELRELALEVIKDEKLKKELLKKATEGRKQALLEKVLEVVKDEKLKKEFLEKLAKGELTEEELKKVLIEQGGLTEEEVEEIAKTGELTAEELKKL